MMREEFCALLGAEIPEKDYRIIENVYTWHPLMDNACYADMDPKSLVVLFYKVGGLQIFREMTCDANTMKSLIDMRDQAKLKGDDVKAQRYQRTIDAMILSYEGLTGEEEEEDGD